MVVRTTAIFVLVAAFVFEGSAAAGDVCIWGTPGYRSCVEEKIRKLRESEVRGRPETAPVAPPGTRAPSRSGPIAPPQVPFERPPVREWRVGPPPGTQFGIDADAVRARIDRTGPASPNMVDLERDLRLLSMERPLDPMERNRRDFEVDQLRRRAIDRRLFADPPAQGLR